MIVQYNCGMKISDKIQNCKKLAKTMKCFLKINKNQLHLPALQMSSVSALETVRSHIFIRIFLLSTSQMYMIWHK